MIVWGSYDEGKPRVRLLLDALRRAAVITNQIHISAWGAIEDKAVAGFRRLLTSAFRILTAYPGAMARLAREPRGGTVLLPYPAIPDVFLAAPVARLRGHRLVLDAFLPLHDTIVGDRKLFKAGSIVAGMIGCIG
jgi:hypothetical protein